MALIPKALKTSIGVIVAVAALAGAAAIGVRIGTDYKTYRVLFELGTQEALMLSAKQALGIQRTYSEKLQDLWVVTSVRPGKRDGFYVDIGSADGVKDSNTKLMDQMGWKGICVDPFPTNMSSRTCQVFRQPVFSVSGKKVSFKNAGFAGGITETLGVTAAEAAVQQSEVVEFTTATLDELLDKAHAPNHIDYMSLDVEGAEYEALRGLSLDKYQVEAFTIEHNNEHPKREMIRDLLQSKGYTLVRSWYREDWYVLHDLPYQFNVSLELRKL